MWAGVLATGKLASMRPCRGSRLSGIDRAIAHASYPGQSDQAGQPGNCRRRWAYAASLHRFWIDQVTDWALVKPIRKLAHDLAYFDDHVVDRAMGIPLPSQRSISTLAQLEKRKIAKRQSLYASLGVLGTMAQPRKRDTAVQQAARMRTLPGAADLPEVILSGSLQYCIGSRIVLSYEVSAKT